MNRFLYSILLSAIITAPCQSQTFINQPNILEQYAAPRYIQYYSYDYSNIRTIYFDQTFTVPVRTRLDIYEYNPYYIQYNWTKVSPVHNYLPNFWQQYQYYIPYRY